MSGLPHQDKRDVFDTAASRFDTLASDVEKDYWVCLVLEAPYNRLLLGPHPPEPPLGCNDGNSIDQPILPIN